MALDIKSHNEGWYANQDLRRSRTAFLCLKKLICHFINWKKKGLFNTFLIFWAIFSDQCGIFYSTWAECSYCTFVYIYVHLIYTDIKTTLLQNYGFWLVSFHLSKECYRTVRPSPAAHTTVPRVLITQPSNSIFFFIQCFLISWWLIFCI